MAGPSKVEFPGKKKQQRMRARGTKRASAGVLKKLEKNLSELLEDPVAILPVADYVVRRMRKDPVQRSLKECAKVIVKKNDRKWLGKRMVKRGGDGVARALAGSLHATHDDERNMDYLDGEVGFLQQFHGRDADCGCGGPHSHAPDCRFGIGFQQDFSRMLRIALESVIEVLTHLRELYPDEWGEALSAASPETPGELPDREPPKVKTTPVAEPVPIAEPEPVA